MTDLKALTAALQQNDAAKAWELIAQEDKRKENPPHGHKGHRVSRNCDQCVENAT